LAPIPQPLLLALLALVGLGVGSFLNVIIDRLPQGVSLVRPRSYCPQCLRPLSPLDMVPVLSYLWLRGRCRYCRAPIPWRLPVVEATTGALFLGAGLLWGYSVMTGIALIYISILVVIFFIDLETGLILNAILYPAMVLALLLAPWGWPGVGSSIWRSYLLALGGGALGFTVMLAIYLASRGGMGEGDVKMAAFMGLALGVRMVLVALPVSFVLGGLVALLLLALRVRGRRQAIPYGPILSVGMLVTMFWGEGILSWYRGLFGL